MRPMRSYWLAMLPLLLAVLTGCEREPMAAGEADAMRTIRFNARPELSSAVTRSGEDVPDASDYLFTNGNQIGVFATWMSDEHVSTDVFSKIPVTYDDGDWLYSPLKYWRRGGMYYFRAIFPFGVNTQYGTDGTCLVASYSMFADNYDLMVAGYERDMAGDDTSPVPLVFKHACAAVRVVFRKGSEDENRHYLLNSCQMKYLRSMGVLVYDQDDVTLDSWQSAEFRSPSVLAWSAGTENQYIDVPASYTDFKQVNDFGWNQWHFVIPQNLNEDDGNHPALEFSMHVRQYHDDGVTLSYQTDEPVYTTLRLPETYTENDQTKDFCWEPGKTYSYYVQIQAGQASINVEVVDWDAYYVYVDDLIF